MPHPFFDGIAYPWKREDARAFHRALYTAVSNSGDIEEFFKAAGPGLSPLTQGIPPDRIWREALDKLVSGQRLADLCTLLLADADIAAIHDQVRAIQNARDPIEEVVLSGEQIFVNRQQLRDKLQLLASSETRRVLLVRGGAKSGKSWTAHMTAELARTMGEQCIYLFEGLIYTIDDVLDQLFTTLGDPKGVPDRLETEDAWFRKICPRLQALSAKNEQVSWLVIDDLGGLDSLIRKFVDQIVLSMANPSFAKWFRVVLIDYPDAQPGTAGRGVPTKWRDVWDEDRPDVMHVDTTALETFILRWAARKKKQIGQAEAQKLATEVIAAVDATVAATNPPPPRLQSIHDTLLKTLKRL